MHCIDRPRKRDPDRDPDDRGRLGSTDIVFSACALHNAPNAVGGETVGAAQRVDNFSVDGKDKTVVIRPDPEPALLIYIEAVHVFYGIGFFQQTKAAAGIAVQAGAGPNPQDTVIRLDNIICVPAGQTAARIIDLLDIRGVFHCLAEGISMRTRSMSTEKKRQDTDRSPRFPFRTDPIAALFDERDRKRQQEDRNELIQKIQIQFSGGRGDDVCGASFGQIVSYAVAPDIACASAIEQEIQDDGNQCGPDCKAAGQRGRFEEGFKVFLPCRHAGADADENACQTVEQGIGIPIRIDDIAGAAHKGTADRTQHVGGKNGSDAVQPEGKLQRGGKMLPDKIDEHTPGSDKHRPEGNVLQLVSVCVHNDPSPRFSCGSKVRPHISALIMIVPLS